jgi:hypothetical protein
MNFGPQHYVPCLRWKQGEYQAVRSLSEATKDFITPLIEVPEKGFDFETQSDKKSIDEHLAPFAKRVSEKWGDRPCFVDLKLIPASERMQGGIHPVRFVFDQLELKGCAAVPVTGLNRDAQYHIAVLESVARGPRGVCIRITLEEAAKSSLRFAVEALLADKAPMEECDFILDLEAPNFLPVDGFARLIESLIRQLPFLNRWRTFSMIGTSFPSTMGEIQTSEATIPRNEWLLYKQLVPALRKSGIRIPAFGDYAINHPEVLQMDMRLLKPAGTIRYATDDGWLIVKGPNVRDNGFGQYVNHCKNVTRSTSFSGSNFSKADKYILDCAAGRASTGNLSTWRWVGTNHHIEKVAQDVASFSDF